jgi:hypothetical protein
MSNLGTRVGTIHCEHAITLRHAVLIKLTFSAGTKRVAVTALYDAKNYRPRALDMLDKPIFLS